MPRARFAALALLVLPLAACATSPPLDAQCAANAMCAARAREPAIPAISKGHAERHGDMLILHPSQASALVFTDHTRACEQSDAAACDGFALIGDFPTAGALVVQKFYYEGSDFFLVDSSSGRQTKLNGMPTFSPDGRTFLVAPFDDESDVGPNNLELWRRRGDGAVIEWAHPAKQAFAEDPALPALYQSRVLRWNGERITLAFSTEGPQIRHWTGMLTRDQYGWRLEAKSPPGLFAANQK